VKSGLKAKDKIRGAEIVAKKPEAPKAE